ncbi:MAG: hypothetical protein IPH07_39430 [Deltaproteobacteria bacterium]|nr:hypothetical protein [Deltaproteobacteria bacterium]
MTRRTTSILTTLTAATAGVLIGDACKFSELRDHCANSDGNEYCIRKYEDESDLRPYCARGTNECSSEYPSEARDGCVAERPADDMCYSPCGGMKSLSDDPDCEGVADDSSSSADSTVSATASTTDTTGPTSSTSSMTGSTMSTTDPSSSTGPQGCAGDDECGGPGTPICIDQVCSPCESDAQCAAKDPANPACRDDGQCVQCTASNDDGCGGATPICDAAVNTCMGCAFHEQCPDSACRIATGECFDEADVHTVGAGQDFEDFTAAAGSLGAEMAVLRVASGVDFNEAIVLSGSSAVWAILDANPDDDTLPLWARTSGNTSTLSIDAGAEVYIQGISVSGNIGSSMFPGIAVDNASLYLDRARVVQNAGGGISLDNGGYALVRNSFVGGNGNGASDTPGLKCSDSDAVVLYTSLVRNDAINDDTLTCNAGSNVDVRNSLLLGRDPSSINCNATVTYSVVDEMFAGTGNHQVAMLNNMWFVNVGASDFTPTAMGLAEFGDVAQWQSGDPLVDIDGDARPGVDGSADVAGADIP